MMNIQTEQMPTSTSSFFHFWTTTVLTDASLRGKSFETYDVDHDFDFGISTFAFGRGSGSDFGAVSGPCFGFEIYA
jgi:hypothetical protein